VLPQLGSVALQAGARAGENITGLIAGKQTEPFRYTDKGMMAIIGRGAAVVQLSRGRTLKGKLAYLAWGAVHLALLTSGESRAKSLLDWGWAGVTRRRTHRLSVDTAKK
jgi:NADH dehydrogenase